MVSSVLRAVLAVALGWSAAGFFPMARAQAEASRPPTATPGSLGPDALPRGTRSFPEYLPACPAPTGTRLAPRRDAEGRCPDPRTGLSPTRVYGRGDIDATGYVGDLGASLQVLDPALNRF